jgi:hypothetical protein
MRITIDLRDQLTDLMVEVIRPTLDVLAAAEPRLRSPAAERLLLGTALVESWGHNIAQDGPGPALGLWQMEPATHDWLWHDPLVRMPRVRARIERLRGHLPGSAARLAGDHYYACAMARMRYWVVPAALPAADDIEGLGAYWKRHYNTPLGAGTVDGFVRRYRRHAVPVLAALG